jgi:hypothetical protein
MADMAGGKSEENSAKQSRATLVSWCLAGAVAIVLVFASKTPAWTIALLVALWVLLMIPAMHIPSIRNAMGWNRGLNAVLAVMIVSAAVVSFGFNVWPAQGIGRLTTKERNQFIADIKPASNPWPVKLMCPPNEEKECIAGAQFMSLFGIAGWPLTQQSLGVCPSIQNLHA